ncbi:MAG: acyl-CoA dehydrogenase [Anaerolineales bacterium]|nr:acyl-CoA dehydrogenase [Anaerolineales bacterium]
MNFEFTDEQRMWRQAVREFVNKEVRPGAAEMDARDEFNAAAIKKMGPMGLLGMTVPEAFGGSGVDAISTAIAIEELGMACGGTALAVAAHNSLGCAPIAMFGTQDQKERWLPDLATRGDILAALALTEPGAGSDLAGGVHTRAEKDGKEWVINGSKAWITNASVASVIVTLCRTDPEGGSSSFSLIVVPADVSGLHIHPDEKKMGVRASHAHALTYENVRVPLENLLGETGQGLYQALEVLDGGRIGIGALSIGLAQAALDEAIQYAKLREAFGVPLAEHQAVQWMIADAATNIEAARLLVYRAAWMKDRGEIYTKEVAMAKLFASEMAEVVCRDAIQILGSYGYSREYPVERYYRDVRLTTIGEGTSEIQRMVIAKRVLA